MNQSPTKVLISGFKPFGSSKLNPSELLVNELVKEEIPGSHVLLIPRTTHDGARRFSPSGSSGNSQHTLTEMTGLLSN
jgi:hypothetical protein